MTLGSPNVRAIAVATVLALAGLAGAVAAQNFSSAPVATQYFKIDVQSGVGKKGEAVLRGYVYNRSPWDVGNVRLRVDPASGDTPSTPLTRGWVNGDIETNGRRYFELAVPRGDASYRVSVESYEVRFSDLSG